MENAASTRQANQHVDGLFAAGSFKEWLERDRQAAFEALVDSFREEIFDLCVRVSGNRSEAEDLTQETFIKAYENLSNFREDASLKTWLYRIAINRSISFTRRIKRWRIQRGPEGEEMPVLIEEGNPLPDRQAIWSDQSKRAHLALQKLSDRQKIAVILRVVKEMEYEDIAASMGITVGGVKANVHQGLKKIRLYVEG